MNRHDDPDDVDYLAAMELQKGSYLMINSISLKAKLQKYFLRLVLIWTRLQRRIHPIVLSGRSLMRLKDMMATSSFCESSKKSFTTNRIAA